MEEYLTVEAKDREGPEPMRSGTRKKSGRSSGTALTVPTCYWMKSGLPQLLHAQEGNHGSPRSSEPSVETDWGL